MSNVFKNEEGEYGTYPDGDKSNRTQIILYEIEQDRNRRHFNVAYGC